MEHADVKNEYNRNQRRSPTIYIATSVADPSHFLGRVPSNNSFTISQIFDFQIIGKMNKRIKHKKFAQACSEF